MRTQQVTPEQQEKIKSLLKKFERKEPKSLSGSAKDLQYAVKLLEHYQNIEETGGHLVKLFQPGPLSIEHYPRHKAFFDATATHKEVLFRAANRIGKSESGAYATACWATGLYPEWWNGRRFDKATYGWVCGDTNDTVRTILQDKLLGTPQGTGLLPKELIEDVVVRPNTGGTVDMIYVRHQPTGKISRIKFKCHPYSSRILMADGTWANIGDVNVGDFIRSPDGSSREVTQRFVYEDAPVLKIETPTGSLECTPNHPVFTENRGWVEAGDLVVGDRLQTCFFESENHDRKEDWEVALTALMIGDGCTRANTPFFTCNEPEIVELVKGVLPDHLRIQRVNNTISYKLYTTNGHCNKLTNLLRDSGLWGKLSKDKHIPEWVYRLPREQRVTFLRWLWGCDGTISPKHAMYCSASKRLAEDVRLLLWSLGIETKVSETKCSAYPDNTYYQVRLNGENRHLFSEIGKLNRPSNADFLPREREDRTTIKRITECQNQTVYCVGVEDVHELIVEGYRVGNTYQSGPDSFYGAAPDYVWMDEEPSGKDAQLIWNQCYIRLLTTNGTLIITFTPLMGWTPLVKNFSETAEDLTPSTHD